MSNYKSSFDAGQGEPNLGALQYLQEQFPPSVISKLAYVCKVEVTTGGNVGIEADIPVGAEIIGVTVVCTKTNGGGTMTVKTGATVPADISDAIACATDKAIDYAATLDDAYNIVGSDGVKVFANAAADAGNVYIHYIK